MGVVKCFQFFHGFHVLDEQIEILYVPADRTGEDRRGLRLWHCTAHCQFLPSLHGVMPSRQTFKDALPDRVENGLIEDRSRMPFLHIHDRGRSPGNRHPGVVPQDAVDGDRGIISSLDPNAVANHDGIGQINYGVILFKIFGYANAAAEIIGKGIMNQTWLSRID